MENAGVGVLSQICLENCHSYAGAISIMLLGNHKVTVAATIV